MPRSGMRSTTGSIRPRASDATSLSRHTRTASRATHLTTPRTAPRSIDVVDAASLATLSLRPPPSGLSPPRPLATTLKHRKIGRSALTFFSCGRNVFIHFAGTVLFERRIVKAAPGTKELEDAAEQVWIEVAMYESEQRSLWEDAAREAKLALMGDEFTTDVLLEAHCIPQYKTRYEALAAYAVDELLKRHAAGTWPRNGVTPFARDVAEAARRASSYTPKMSETTEKKADHAIERDIVSAINLRDLPSEHFVGVEPSLRRFNVASSVYSKEIDQSSVRSATPTLSAQEAYPYPTSGPTEVIDAAATARLYLDLNMTPPRSNRDSLQSITTSLCTDTDTIAEICTTERVTPAKAKIVDC